MKTLFWDIDTQLDFMAPAGALYVPGAETIVGTVAALNRYAAAHGIQVLSSVDAHLEDDIEFKTWPHHCVAGTAGQQKCAATLLEKRIVIPNALCSPSIEGAQQIVVEKQTIDVFSNVNLAALLQQLDAARHVVYGVVTEICVLRAALGLAKSGVRVEVVTDAIRGLSDEASRKALAELSAAGCALVHPPQ
ncbi:MAG TPA: isochorismatase family protein [Bryobacteraceae bacterium]|nr:isochorismatase family protein [Bryobacteraceae bacterium]